MCNTLGLVAGSGLLTVTGDCHKQMRKAMNPAFSISNLISREYRSSRSTSEIECALETDTYYDAIDKYANSSQITYSLSSEYISFLSILNSCVEKVQGGQGSVAIMYDWNTSLIMASILLIFHVLRWTVSKVMLDIICLTGLEYKANSLRNPRNELAQAYEELQMSTAP